MRRAFLSLLCLTAACIGDRDESATPDAETELEPDAGTPSEGEAESESEAEGEGEAEAESESESEAESESESEVELPTVEVDDFLTVGELEDLEIGTPATILTVIRGTERIALAAAFAGFVANPQTLDVGDPYLFMETVPTDDPTTPEVDDLWARWGGAAAGMSGSPIMIDGRLAGALSYSIGSNPIGPYSFIATPFEKMVEVGEGTEYAAATSESGALPAAAVLVGGVGADFLDEVWNDENPFVVRGAGIVPVGGDGGGGLGEGDTTLEPGSAIALNFIVGDMVSMSAIGTVTATDGDRLWAFGHPMFQAGESHLPFSAAQISGITADPFYGAMKYGGAIGPTQGAIVDDRMAAIAGEFEEEADTITVTTVVNDERYDHTVARVPPIALFYGLPQDWLMAFAAVMPVFVEWDAQSPGSATYELEIEFAETDEVARRTGVVADDFDIVGGLMWGAFMSAIDTFDPTWSWVPPPTNTITNFRVEVTDMSTEIREITIDDVTAPETVHPGELVTLTITYHRHGSSDLETVPIYLEVPADFPLGLADLEVGSELPAFVPSEPEEVGPPTLDEIIAEFNSQPRDHVIEARLLPFWYDPETVVVASSTLETTLVVRDGWSTWLEVVE